MVRLFVKNGWLIMVRSWWAVVRHKGPNNWSAIGHVNRASRIAIGADNQHYGCNQKAKK